MLISTAFTFLSLSRISNACVTCSSLAPPPTSRKFAGIPPANWMMSMVAMDIIQYAGGMPANFLDVGGGANEEQVTHAFEILLADKNVQAVLINIFGGILRVDTLANGVVSAAKKTNIHLPIVLRLEGTNVEQGREILKNSGLNFIVAHNMKDAAEKVVAAAKGVK